MIDRTILHDLPAGCKGFLCRDEQSDYYVAVLNARYNTETNRKTLLHEIEHVENRDLESTIDVGSIERMRHE